MKRRVVGIAGVGLGLMLCLPVDAVGRRTQTDALREVEELLADAELRTDELELEYGTRGGLLGGVEAEERYREGVYLYLYATATEHVASYESAALHFFALVESGALIDEGKRQDADWYLADSLYQMGNYGVANDYFVAISEEGESHLFFEDAVRRQLDIQDQLGNHQGFLDVYDRYIVSERVEQTDDLSYTLGKHLFGRGLYAQAKNVFLDIGQVPGEADMDVCERAARVPVSENEYLGRACYFIGVIHTVQSANVLDPAGELEDAMAAFEVVANIEGQDNRITEQALLALARISKEQGEYATAVAYYQQISDASEILDLKLYELIYTFIDQGLWSEALAEVDIFLTAYPDHRWAAQMHLLKGHLHMLEDQLQLANTAYEDLRDRSDPVRELLEDVSENEEELARIYDNIVDGVDVYESSSYVLPAYALQMLVGNEDVGRVTEVNVDMAQQGSDLAMSQDMLEEVSAALELSERSVGTFNQGRRLLTNLRDDVLYIQHALLRAETAFLVSRVESDSALEELGRIEANLELLAERSGEIGRTDSDQSTMSSEDMERRRQLQREIAEVEDSLRDTETNTLAREQEFEQARENLSEEHIGLAEDALAQLRADIDEQREQLEELRAQEARLQYSSTVGMGSTSDTDSQRDMLLDEYQRIHRQLRGFHSQVTGSDAPSTFGRINAVMRDSANLDERVQRVRQTLEETEGDALSMLEETLDEQQVEVANLQSDFDSVDADVDFLSTDVVGTGFEALEDELFGVIMDARRGIAEVFWVRKSNATASIEDLRTQRARATSELDARFFEIQRMLEEQEEPVDGETSLAIDIESGDDDDAVVGESMALYNETLGRYARAMSEFDSEVRIFVDQRRNEEEAAIRDAYVDRINDDQDTEIRHRETAINRLRGFLLRYPVSHHRPDVLFRLAELYVEEANLEWGAAKDEYDYLLALAIEADDLEAISTLQYPVRDYRDAMRLYTEIERDYRDYNQIGDVYLMLGAYVHPDLAAETDAATVLLEGVDSEGLTRQPDEISNAYFERLISEFPDHEYAADAHLQIGRYYFEVLRNMSTARNHFEHVVNLERESDMERYDDGLYMLAWTWYRQANPCLMGAYENSLRLLDQLLVHYDETRGSTPLNEQSLYQPAVKYSAISLIDMSDSFERSALDACEEDESSGDQLAGLDLPRYLDSGTRDVEASALGQAMEFYRRIGRRTHEIDVYKTIAERLLEDPDRRAESLAIYAHIQEQWPDDPENPDMQWQRVQLLARLLRAEPDNAAYGEMYQQGLSDLYLLYNEDSEWARVNRARPDALARAQGYIRQTLAMVAANYWNDALALDPDLNGGNGDEIAAQNLYSQAADSFRAYVNDYPDAENYYQMMFMLADALRRTEAYDEADQELTQLLKADEHFFVESARFLLQDVRALRLIADHGDVATLPEEPLVQEVVENVDGEPREVYTLGDDHLAYIEACDEVVDADFGPEIERIDSALVTANMAVAAVPSDDEAALQNANAYVLYVQAAGTIARDHQGYLENTRLSLAYDPALIFHEHGHYEESRRRFREIIDNPLWQGEERAVTSARLIVESYALEGDTAMMLQASREFRAMDLGSGGSIANSADYFGEQEEFAAFVLAENLWQDGVRLRREGSEDEAVVRQREAAEAFGTFIEEYPDASIRTSEDADSPDRIWLSLNRRAVFYGAHGTVEQKIDAFQQFTEYYPNEADTMQYYLELGNIYQSALMFQEAVDAYELLYERNRENGHDYGPANDGLIAASWLRGGLGQYEAAARGFERYATENPDLPNAEETFFSAGEQWEQVGNAEAITFYQRYIRSYSSQNPDNLMEARYRVIALTEEMVGDSTRRADRRRVERAWEDLATQYTSLGGAETFSIGSDGRDYLGRYELRAFLADFEEWEDISFGTNSETNGRMVNEKREAMTELQERGMALINEERVVDFESVSGLLVTIGEGWLHLSNSVNANVEALMADYDRETEETEQDFRDQVDEFFVREFRNRARPYLDDVLAIAANADDWSEWQTLALELLASVPSWQREDGTPYAEERAEYRGPIRRGTVNDEFRAVSVELDPAGESSSESEGAE